MYANLEVRQVELEPLRAVVEVDVAVRDAVERVDEAGGLVAAGEIPAPRHCWLLLLLLLLAGGARQMTRRLFGARGREGSRGEARGGGGGRRARDGRRYIGVAHTRES